MAAFAVRRKSESQAAPFPNDVAVRARPVSGHGFSAPEFLHSELCVRDARSPKGAFYLSLSPGQRPGLKHVQFRKSPERASFQGPTLREILRHPGRCPGLGWNGPSGLPNIEILRQRLKSCPATKGFLGLLVIRNRTTRGRFQANYVIRRIVPISCAS
jgi:hypothetical protein